MCLTDSGLIFIHAERLQIYELRQKQNASQFEIVVKQLLIHNFIFKKSLKSHLLKKIRTLGDKSRNILAKNSFKF